MKIHFIFLTSSLSFLICANSKALKTFKLESLIGFSLHTSTGLLKFIHVNEHLLIKYVVLIISLQNLLSNLALKSVHSPHEIPSHPSCTLVYSSLKMCCTPTPAIAPLAHAWFLPLLEVDERYMIVSSWLPL